MQIGPLPLKKWVVLHMQHHVKVTTRSAMNASFAESAEANPGFVFHSRRNFRFHCLLLQIASFALALRARIAHNTASTLTRGTSSGNAKEPLLIAYLPAAAAGSASCRRFPVGAARTIARPAKFMSTIRNRLLCAKDCFLKLNGDVLTQIGPALCA